MTRLGTAGVLELARRDAARIDVGKSEGNHTMPQADINALLIRLAREGRRVVRLKGGDPFIFGRGGEEIAALQQAGIDCAVVPGITAALACAASALIPLTHRDPRPRGHLRHRTPPPPRSRHRLCRACCAPA